MPTDPIAEIRAAVAAAKAQEAQAATITGLLRDSMEGLHTAIALPDTDAISALQVFVVRYIDHVADFLEAILTLTEEAGISEQSAAFIVAAEALFLETPQRHPEMTGLHALLDGAYLAHRLLEEVNDRFIGRCGIPLAPLDTTRSNVIIHHLIGEPHANELDQLVDDCAEKLMHRDGVFQASAFQAYVNEHKSRGWTEELERWPCLASDLSINLQLGLAQGHSDPEPDKLH